MTSNTNSLTNFNADKIEVHNTINHGTLPPEPKITPEEKTFREELARRAIRSASYDSAQRRHRPTCSAKTRVKIQKSLRPWPSDRTAGPVRLLSGWTGTGKTTLAQTMAEYWAEQGWLAAVFFFSRSEEDRSSTAWFAGTILHQLLQTRHLSITSLAPFTTSQVSWSQVVDVLRSALPLSSPMVIIIDGLDECRDYEEQETLLDDILSSVDRLGPSIKFLISCRPESHLEDVFDKFDFKLGSSYRIPLGQSIEDSNDIRTFLQESFDEICRKRRKPERKAMSIIDRPWPSKEEIEKLVDRASGQFIFPATVIKVIDNKMEDPVKMLNRVLERQTPSFEAIDSLYLVILERVEEQIHLVLQEKPRAAERCQLMRDLLLHVNTHPSSSRDIANFWFEEEVTTIDILVANMQAVLVRDEDTGLIHFRHQSFHDFLVHPSEPPHAFSVANMNPVSRFFLSLRILAAKSRPPIPKGSFSLPIGALQYLEYAYLYYGGHPLSVFDEEEAQRLHQRYVHNRSTFRGCSCLSRLDAVLADVSALRIFKSCGEDGCIVNPDFIALFQMMEMPIDEFIRESKAQENLRPISFRILKSFLWVRLMLYGLFEPSYALYGIVWTLMLRSSSLSLLGRCAAAVNGLLCIVVLINTRWEVVFLLYSIFLVSFLA